jgi:hypothetical protein
VDVISALAENQSILGRLVLCPLDLPGCR